MGGTSFRHYDRTTLECIRGDIDSESARGTWKLIDHSRHGNVFYCLIERKLSNQQHEESIYVKDANGAVRYICVFLTSRNKSEFYYKDMDECMQPYYFDCPKRLIDKASKPIDSNGYVAKWRAQCLENVTDKAKKVKLVDGMKIKLASPLSFSDGFKGDTFTVTTLTRRGRKTRVFQADGRFIYYRIPKIEQREFSIL